MLLVFILSIAYVHVT